jgi:hypothetical protein
MNRAHAVLAAGSVLLAGCAQVALLGLAADDRDGVEFRTRDDRYTLSITAGVATLDIAFTFENHTGRTLHVVNCNGIAPPALEKREGDRWVLAYVPAVPACLSPPIRIEDGDIYQGTLHVDAAVPASPHRQSFEVDDIEGTYRLLWDGVLYDFNPNRFPFGEDVDVELRTSESFFIDDPRN